MSPAPLHVLVVEDEGLIAMEIAMMLEDAGHEVIGEAACFDEVMGFDARITVDLALVDVRLAHGTSGIDAVSHIRRCWPDAILVFVTTNPKKLLPDFGGAHGVIAKPFSTAGFLSAIHYLEEGITGPPPVSRCPSALLESPGLAGTWGTENRLVGLRVHGIGSSTT